MSYYKNKIDQLSDIFGTVSIELHDSHLLVAGRSYPIVDDVIVLLEPEHYSPFLAQKLDTKVDRAGSFKFAPEIQSSFGAEWREFSTVLPEHEAEFHQYFDLVDLESLRGKRVADLGAGMGRWSYFLREIAGELVLVDFSDAIFEARETLRSSPNALFFMGDLTGLPFRNDFTDFLFCLGVLHHLPVPAIEQARRLSGYAPRILIYLYSALDGQPLYYRVLFKPIDILRRSLVLVRSERLRSLVAWLIAVLLYRPATFLFGALSWIGIIREPPFLHFYRRKSITRLRQDAYDRFFTGIEQRVSRRDIAKLEDTYKTVTVSTGLPFWHFLCHRDS